MQSIENSGKTCILKMKLLIIQNISLDIKRQVKIFKKQQKNSEISLDLWYNQIDQNSTIPKQKGVSP